MPTNIEIKARARDFQRLRKAAELLSHSAGEILQQEDVFFIVPQGRLKLRIFDSGGGQLIFYQREDHSGPKSSQYFISETDNPQSLREVLSRTLGVRGTVSKTRRVFLIGQTRVHLDEVAGLGHFVELEVVMREDQPAEDGQRIARELMGQLGIVESDLLSEGYIDMMKTNLA